MTIGHLTPPLKSAGHCQRARCRARAPASTNTRPLTVSTAGARRCSARRFSTAPPRPDFLPRVRADRASSQRRTSSPASTPIYVTSRTCRSGTGLHVFGRPPDAQRREEFLASLAQSNPRRPRKNLPRASTRQRRASAKSLLAALDGSSWRRVPPVRRPAAAPTFCRPGATSTPIDPRAVPTRSALVLGREGGRTKLLRRHLQDHGEWPRALVIDLWGSATHAHRRRRSSAGAAAIWARGRSGIKALPASPASRSCRWPSSTVRASTSPCASPACSAMPSRRRSRCSTRRCVPSPRATSLMIGIRSPHLLVA